MSAQTFWISVVPDASRPLELDGGAFPVADLTAQFSQVEDGPKEGEAFIPAVFDPCPDAGCRKGEGGCGGGRSHRLGENVRAITMLVLDLDHLSLEQYAQTIAAVDAADVIYWAWQTYGHAPPDDCRLRIVIPLAHPLPIRDPKEWRKHLWPALVGYLKLPVAPDRACSDPARLYYLPRKPQGSEREAWARMDRKLWAPVLRAEPRKAPQLESALPAAPDGRPMDRDGILAALLATPHSEQKPWEQAAARALARGEAVAPSRDKRPSDHPGRNAAMLAATMRLAIVADDRDPTDALFEAFVRQSFVQMVAEGWHKTESDVYGMLERARPKAAEIHAKWRSEAESNAKIRAALFDMPSAGPSEPAPAAAEETTGAPAGNADELAEVEGHFNLTDLGNCERFIRDHGDQVRFDASRNAWLAWDGRRWATDSKGSAAALAYQTMRGIFREAADEPDQKKFLQLAKHAKSSESAGRIAAMLHLAAQHPRLRMSFEETDLDPFLFNIENGTLDLKKLELRRHDRADKLTKLAPVAFDPSATCPTFDAFLARSLPSEGVRTFLQRFAGYLLTGDVREQTLTFFYGDGHNGKSTLTGILQELLGDYARQGAPDLLISKQNDAHPAEQAVLKGARLVVCSEVEAGRSFAEARVKQLTGGDTITARHMYGSWFEFKPTHKLILHANHKPAVRGTDWAIWRRIRLVPFAVEIPESERDPLLKEKLRAELPGILAWAVRGCAEWQREGLTLPPDVRAATTDYRRAEDKVGRFLAECCQRDAEGLATSGQLYRAFQTWCDTNGERAWSQQAFSKELPRQGLAADKANGVRGWRGVRLLAPSAAERVASARSEAHP